MENLKKQKSIPNTSLLSINEWYNFVCFRKHLLFHHQNLKSYQRNPPINWLRKIQTKIAPPLLRVQAEVVLASAEMILLYHMINFVQHWNLWFPQMILEIFWRIFKKLVKAPQELSSVLRISGQMLNVLWRKWICTISKGENCYLMKLLLWESITMKT